VAEAGIEPMSMGEIDGEVKAVRLPAPDCICEQPFERLGCQEPRLTRSASRCVGRFNLHLRHASFDRIGQTPALLPPAIHKNK
jgi:hypothetical protein